VCVVDWWVGRMCVLLIGGWVEPPFEMIGKQNICLV
jgi:hypothetical protein